MCIRDRGRLRALSATYRDKYQAVPQFKAGAHLGSVIAGEIGIIKRDITYSGDILNTTARIQGQCNALNSQLLISKSLFEYISPNENWIFKPQGAIALRGKKEELELFSVSIF